MTKKIDNNKLIDISKAIINDEEMFMLLPGPSVAEASILCDEIVGIPKFWANKIKLFADYEKESYLKNDLNNAELRLKRLLVILEFFRILNTSYNSARRKSVELYGKLYDCTLKFILATDKINAENFISAPKKIFVLYKDFLGHQIFNSFYYIFRSRIYGDFETIKNRFRNMFTFIIKKNGLDIEKIYESHNNLFKNKKEVFDLLRDNVTVSLLERFFYGSILINNYCDDCIILDVALESVEYYKMLSDKSDYEWEMRKKEERKKKQREYSRKYREQHRKKVEE